MKHFFVTEISEIPFIQQLHLSIPNTAGNKKDGSSWDFPFVPSSQNIHTHTHPPSTISSRADTKTELISFLPKTKNVLNQKICALQEAHFGDGFFDGSGSVSFFSVYTYKHKYVPLRKTLVSIRNHSCPFSQLWFRLGNWSFSLGHEKWALPEGNSCYLS